eukprot:773290_1
MSSLKVWCFISVTVMLLVTQETYAAAIKAPMKQKSPSKPENKLDFTLNAELEFCVAEKWYRGRVVGRNHGKCLVKIRYIDHFFSYDVWLPENSNDLASKGSYIYQERERDRFLYLHTGTELDVKDTNGFWFPGIVIIDTAPRRGTKLHYVGYGSELDTWMRPNSERLALRGSHAKAKWEDVVAATNAKVIQHWQSKSVVAAINSHVNRERRSCNGDLTTCRGKAPMNQQWRSKTAPAIRWSKPSMPFPFIHVETFAEFHHLFHAPAIRWSKPSMPFPFIHVETFAEFHHLFHGELLYVLKRMEVDVKDTNGFWFPGHISSLDSGWFVKVEYVGNGSEVIETTKMVSFSERLAPRGTHTKAKFSAATNKSAKQKSPPKSEIKITEIHSNDSEVVEQKQQSEQLYTEKEDTRPDSLTVQSHVASQELEKTKKK